MNFEEKTKLIELFLMGIGLLFVIFGWIIPYKQSVLENNKRKKTEENLLRKQWEKNFIDKQISEFYGPISAILINLEIRYSIILNQMDRASVFGDKRFSDLSKKDKMIWLHYVHTYKIPSQHRIVEIIKNKRHLVYNSETPICFTVFLKYAMFWELMDNQKKNRVPNYFEYYDSDNFLKVFSNYINNTLAILLQKQQELITSDNNP